MASFTRFNARWGSSAADNSTSSSCRPRTQWARALGLAILFASTVLASQDDDLPEPTAIAAIRLPGLDGAPQPTIAAEIPATPDVEEGLLMDTRIRLWEDGKWTSLHPEEHELRRRTATVITESIAIPVSTADPTTLASSTTRTSSSTSASTESSTATAAPSPLPSFFDGGISNNFTATSCPAFIDTMIAADEFQTCYPMSLLLQGSTSFFDAQKSLVSISRVLDKSCAANVTSCANYFASVASNLTKSENCGADYASGNPTVTQAYMGLIAYQVVYSATCLKDDESQSYCYGDAVTNSTYTEAYYYFLPLNSSLPGATLPQCGACLQDTMSIYHVATANRRQPIANTYAEAAEMTDVLCGSGFANTTLADAITTSRGVRSGPPMVVVTAALMVAAGWLL